MLQDVNSEFAVVIWTFVPSRFRLSCGKRTDSEGSIIRNLGSHSIVKHQNTRSRAGPR